MIIGRNFNAPFWKPANRAICQLVMLRSTEKDEGLEQHFRYAYFEQQKANESLVSISNAAHPSSKDTKTRASKESLLPLRQQLALLQHHLAAHENDSVAFQLLSDLNREYVVGSASLVVPRNSADAAAGIDRFFSSFKV